MIKDSDNVKLLEPGKTPAKRKILVVEDNELNREILSSFLEERFEVLLAENGEEGLKILREYYRELQSVMKVSPELLRGGSRNVIIVRPLY